MNHPCNQGDGAVCSLPAWATGPLAQERTSFRYKAFRRAAEVRKVAERTVAECRSRRTSKGARPDNRGAEGENAGMVCLKLSVRRPRCPIPQSRNVGRWLCAAPFRMLCPCRMFGITMPGRPCFVQHFADFFPKPVRRPGSRQTDWFIASLCGPCRTRCRQWGSPPG